MRRSAGWPDMRAGCPSKFPTSRPPGRAYLVRRAEFNRSDHAVARAAPGAASDRRRVRCVFALKNDPEIAKFRFRARNTWLGGDHNRSTINGFYGAGARYGRGAAPHEPHWYLPLIGVVPSHRRRGLGAALMAHALRTCDGEGAPAYLEATSAKSMTLYQRHGFRQIGTIQAGRSPEMYPMLREP